MEKQDFIKWVTKIQPTYTSSPQVKKVLSNIDLIALVGPTGAGKTAIAEAAKLPNVLSDTTREPREFEKNNKDYHFRNDYLKIIDELKYGDFVQFVVIHQGEFYGTRIDSYPSNGVCVFAVVATAVPILQTLGFKSVKPVYVLPPSYVEWMHRITKHNDLNLHDRLKEARESLEMVVDSAAYDFILNDNIEDAVKDLQTLAKGEAISTHRTQLAKASADVLLGRVQETL